MQTVLPGDCMGKWPAGGMFIAKDVAAEQARFDRRETVPLGPIFGKKTFPAAERAAEREAALLRDAELTVAHFSRFGKLLLGTRRQNLVFINDLAATIEDSGVRIAFSLPAGSYATVLLRELMKKSIGDELPA
jgi:tRNA pseudouridine13 synthase